MSTIKLKVVYLYKRLLDSIKRKEKREREKEKIEKKINEKKKI